MIFVSSNDLQRPLRNCGVSFGVLAFWENQTLFDTGIGWSEKEVKYRGLVPK